MEEPWILTCLNLSLDITISIWVFFLFNFPKNFLWIVNFLTIWRNSDLFALFEYFYTPQSKPCSRYSSSVEWFHPKSILCMPWKSTNRLDTPFRVCDWHWATSTALYCLQLRSGNTAIGRNTSRDDEDPLTFF